MPIARSVEELIADVPGIRFSTDARPGTPEEGTLQEIQSALSGGIFNLPLGTTSPHLNYYYVAIGDGPSYSAISLWVPKQQRSQALELLQSAGYTVS